MSKWWWFTDNNKIINLRQQVITLLYASTFNNTYLTALDYYYFTALNYYSGLFFLFFEYRSAVYLMYTNAVCFSTEKWPLPLVCFRLEGLMELYSQGCERSYTVNSSILRTIEPHLKDFQQLLLDPPKVLASVKSASLSVKCDFIESVTLTFFFSFFFFGIFCSFNPLIDFVHFFPALFSNAEKCNTHNCWCSGAAVGEHAPSCGQAGGLFAADKRQQHLARAL